MSLENLKLDSEEFGKLLLNATRSRVKESLIQAKAEVDREIVALEVKARLTAQRQEGETDSKRYRVELNEYGWDQSDKFVKLFITLNGVQNCKKDNITLKLTGTSMQLLISNLNSKDYELTVNNLLGPIDLEKSYHKIKTDMVAIYLKKAEEGKHWSHLTTIMHRLKQKQESEISKDSENPESALVNIMKKMYQDSDLKTKQMIAKAWTESQEKARHVDMDTPQI